MVDTEKFHGLIKVVLSCTRCLKIVLSLIYDYSRKEKQNNKERCPKTLFTRVQKKTSPDILYKIDRSLSLALKITSVVVLVMLVLAAIYPVLKLLFFISWGLWGVLLVGKICLSPFVKSEEEEEFEQQVNYILQQKQAAMQAPQKDYSPLCNLSAEQEEQIKELLRSLPEHPDKPTHINLAITAQYLTALEKLGKANLKDKRNLRIWVETVTGKQTPNSSQFNEAIPSTAKNKVAAARKELERLLQLQ